MKSAPSGAYIWGLTFVELIGLRVAQGGEERKGRGRGAAGARGCWWLGLWVCRITGRS